MELFIHDSNAQPVVSITEGEDIEVRDLTTGQILFVIESTDGIWSDIVTFHDGVSWSTWQKMEHPLLLALRLAQEHVTLKV